MTKYRRKMVLSGCFAEVYDFQNLHILHCATQSPNRSIREKKMESQRSPYSRFRAQENIRRVVQCNPDLNKFITLTFKENITDLKKANYLFKKFVGRMKTLYPQFKYLVIVEFQKRGAVHYHGICRLLDYFGKAKLQEVWQYGSQVHVSKVRNINKVGGYFAKHGTKDRYAQEATGLYGQKKFFGSRNLQRPREIYDDKIIDDFVEHFTEKIQYETSWITDRQEFVTYKQYITI